MDGYVWINLPKLLRRFLSGGFTVLRKSSRRGGKRCNPFCAKHFEPLVYDDSGELRPWVFAKDPGQTGTAYLQWPSRKITDLRNLFISFWITKNHLNFRDGNHLVSLGFSGNVHPVDPPLPPFPTRRSSMGVALMRSSEAWSPSSRSLGTTPGTGQSLLKSSP